MRERTEIDEPEQHQMSATLKPEKKLTFDQIADVSIAKDAVEKAGRRQTINNCKDRATT